MEIKILVLYLAIINTITFILFGLDKYKAKKGYYRIPELYLLTLSLIGGSLGACLAMHIFHHKTKKVKFFLVYLFLFIWIFSIWKMLK